MVRKNIMNALLVLLAAGALLTIYNAFLNSNNDSETNASTKLASYLNVDSAKQEAEGAEDIVAGTDSSATDTTASTDTTTTPDTSTPDESASTDTTATNEDTDTSTSTPTTTTTADATDKAETVYTVKEGDTYGCIAEKYYGSYEHYVDIMAANPVSQYGFSEYQLFVGAQLTLPAISGSHLKPASSLC